MCVCLCAFIHVYTQLSRQNVNFTWIIYSSFIGLARVPALSAMKKLCLMICFINDHPHNNAMKLNFSYTMETYHKMPC